MRIAISVSEGQAIFPKNAQSRVLLDSACLIQVLPDQSSQQQNRKALLPGLAENHGTDEKKRHTKTLLPLPQ